MAPHRVTSADGGYIRCAASTVVVKSPPWKRRCRPSRADAREVGAALRPARYVLSALMGGLQIHHNAGELERRYGDGTVRHTWLL